VSVEAMAWVLNHSTARGTDKVVLLGIANHADPEGRNAWPSLERLAGYANITARQAQRVRQRLEEQGRIEVEPQRGGLAEVRNDRRPNRYRVVMNTAGPALEARPERPPVVPAPRGDIDGPLPPEGNAHGVTPETHGVTLQASRGDIDSRNGVTQLCHPNRPTPNRPTEEPSPPADADGPSPDEGALFGLDVPPTPVANPVQALVGAYVEAVEASGGIATTSMRGAIGSNLRRLIREDGLPEPVLLAAVQVAGGARSRTLDRWLGDAQRAYGRRSERRAMFDRWTEIAERLDGGAR
jgi:hypothetical protein